MNYKFRFKRIRVVSLLLVAVLLFPSFLSAQEVNVDITSSVSDLANELSLPKVDLDISSSGRLGETATIKASTDNIFNEVSNFLWYLDDILDQRQSGKSKTNFSFTTSRENHVVRVVIEEGGEKITENAVLVSSYNVSLVWSAETYTPPEYEGKALPSRGSRVSVTAIPDIKDYEADELLYTWHLYAESKVRGVLGEDEFSFLITKSVDSIPVFVEVTNLSRSIVVNQAILIPVVRPSVVIYHKKSERTSEIATKKVAITPGESVDIVAKPFNFRASKIADLNFLWEFIGQKAEGERGNPNILTLSIPENSGFGSENLKLQTTNKEVFQERVSSFLAINITNEQ